MALGSFLGCGSWPRILKSQQDPGAWLVLVGSSILKAIPDSLGGYRDGMWG